MSLAVVDQAKHPVDTNVTSFLYLNEDGFGEGQQIQTTAKSCTNLTFIVFSPFDTEILDLYYAKGPCGNSELSVRNSILFTNCTYPIGFRSSNSPTRCECICVPQLAPYITIYESTNSLLRVGTNSWITYVNDSNSTGYIIRPIYPFDYCQPETENISVNLNAPGGANTICIHNHNRR